MAKASKVSPTLYPNMSLDDDVDANNDEDNDEENDNVSSLKTKGEMIFKALIKIKLLVPTSWKLCPLPLRARNILRSWNLI